MLENATHTCMHKHTVGSFLVAFATQNLINYKLNASLDFYTCNLMCQLSYNQYNKQLILIKINVSSAK